MHAARDVGLCFFRQNTFLRCLPLATGHPFGIGDLAWDDAVTNRPGAQFDPRAIRQASHMLSDGTHPQFNIDLGSVLGDAGDLLLPNNRLETSVAWGAVQTAAPCCGSLSCQNWLNLANRPCRPKGLT